MPGATECPICYDAYSPLPASRECRFAFGASCGHTLCHKCAARVTYDALGQLTLLGIAHEGYLSPETMTRELPGLFCPQCCPTPAALKEAARLHWVHVAQASSALMHTADTWRVALPAAGPWGLRLVDAAGLEHFRAGLPAGGGDSCRSAAPPRARGRTVTRTIASHRPPPRYPKRTSVRFSSRILSRCGQCPR
jgi:hypothetical protein